MGQKVHPLSFRLKINKTWSSKWFASNDKYADLLKEDIQIRKYVNTKLKTAGISSVDIDRTTKNTHITIYAAKPGIIIGRKGADIEILKKGLQKLVSTDIVLNILEIRKPELDGKILAMEVATAIEKRGSYKRAMKMVMSKSMKMGAKGIKVKIGGRLNGAEIARVEWSKEGRVPLHTLRADISYGFAEAQTTYGIIGIKVWIYRGDIVKDEQMKDNKIDAQTLATA
ncbi:MAG: 30S ribosomal protein S3 [Rickettsiales bacterium]|jgi:small subunit ribosomal protein S3|nr:30S ribosomal protein S3 [Rickettsiales bacterium]